MKKIYTLLIALLMTGLGYSQIISQYIETNSGTTPKGIEIWNNTGATLDFSTNNLVIEKGTNGATPSADFTLSTGTLADGDVIVIGTSDMATVTIANGSTHFTKAFTFNGDDALVVKYGGTITDMFGTAGSDPGSSWTGSGVDTRNQNIELNSGLTTGDTDGWTDPSTRFSTVNTDPAGTNGDEGFGIAPSTGGGCTAPTTQATAYNTTSITNTTATLNWTSGDGDEVLVVVKAGSAVDTDPTNGTSYTANTVFSSGDQIGTGNYAVYAGTTASTVSITGLSSATEYHVAVYEYNTTGTCYELTELTGNFTTDCSTPTDVTLFTATAGNTTVDLNWTNGSCFDDILVVAKATSAVSVSPTGDGSAYTANATFGSGTDLGTNEYAVYKGTGSSVTVTGLTNGTTYHFTAFARKTTSWSAGASDSGTPTTAPIAGDIVITEIMYNSSGTDDEWIEIYNASGSDITLDSDWRISYGGSTFDFSSTVITDGSYLTIALGSDGDGTFNDDNPFTPDVSAIATPAATTDDSNNLVNSTATIAVIYDPSSSNVTIDTVIYDDGSPWPTTPDGTGPSLELIDVSSDNTLAASWAASDNNGGTPGSAYPVTFTFSGTWSPSDPNGAAASGDNIIIASGNASIDSGTTCNSVTVNAGAGLTVDSGITLTVSNGLTLESSSTSFSSLILDGTVSGTINYERHVNINGSGTTGSNDLISAPLTGQAFSAFATANPNILSNGAGTLFLFGPFDKTTGEYVTYADTETATLDAGVGYRAASDDNSTFTFTGTANNGTITKDIINSGPAENEWNLIGNPYPSYINVQDFLNHEVSTGVSNLNLFDAGTAAIYGYDGDAINGWTIYNLATTTAATVIAPGQGFFVSADATNAPLYDLEFTPSMRSTGTTDDFIVGRNANGTLIHFTLNLSSNTNSFDTEFYFNPNASAGFDLGFDAELFTNPPFSVFSYLVEENEGDAYQIQALNPSNLDDTTIPLGVRASQGVQLTFSMSLNELPPTIEIFLDDVVANTTTLLNTSDYVFTPATQLAGAGRFFIRTNDTSLSTIENSLDTLNIYALNDSKELVVSGQLQNNTMLNLYDIQGRLVLSTKLDSTVLQNRIDVSSLSGGIYVVNVQNNNQEKSQKVILK
ncbi:lamin tail domain-containing protein [Psychroserpens sp.]|uniref:lamin tail domain-containing protein n=1 Tax=Psychroserpens sp. TaxID=2020870 RepID=UPI002B273C03|nr:lamin tail domain-containing protein [Psychroserpens sp.]